MDNKECKFCRNYRLKRKGNEMTSIDNFNIDYEYTAALVETRWRKLKNGETDLQGMGMNCSTVLNAEDI